MIPVYWKFSIQPNAYPWIAALLRDEDIQDGYINSQCSAVLVCVVSPIIALHHSILKVLLYELFPHRLATDLPWQQLTVFTTTTRRRSCPPAPSPSCSASMTGRRPARKTGSSRSGSRFSFVHYITGHRSGSPRFLSMKTLLIIPTTLPCYALVGWIFPLFDV